jgi:acylphosphatase
MSNILLYRIYVSGRVQGVGFRWNAAREARNRGIGGFVRNMPDGRVFLEAEGEKEILDDYLKWCRKGPAFAHVENVEYDAFPPVGHLEFRISDF